MSWVPAVVEQFPYTGLFALLILGGVGFPFPEDMTLILCGFLIATDVVKPAPALSVVYAGLLTADFILYLIGKKYGEMIVTHRRFRKIISPERLSVIRAKFDKRGVLVILIGRHLVGLRAQIFLAAGVMRMSPVRFLVSDAVSSIFTMAVMVGAGYTGGNSLQIIRRDITRVEHIAVLLAVILLAAYLVVRYVRSRS